MPETAFKKTGNKEKDGFNYESTETEPSTEAVEHETVTSKEKFVTSEQLNEAVNLENLIEIIESTNGLSFISNGRIRVFTPEMARREISDIVTLLNATGKHSPDGLKVSSAEKNLTEKYSLFAAIPTEDGLRTKVMELYDSRRIEIMEKLGMNFSKEEITSSDRAGHAEVKEAGETVLTPEYLRELGTEYVEAIALYRKALSNTFQEKNKKGLVTFLKQQILGRQPHPTEDEIGELRELHRRATILWSQIYSSLKEQILSKDGTEEGLARIVNKLKKEVNYQTNEKVRNGEMISTALTDEYENDIFTNISPDPTASDTDFEMHLDYLARKKEEEETVGKFVSPPEEQTEEETEPTPEPSVETKAKEETAEEPVSPEKSIKALTLLEKMKREGGELSQRASELLSESGKNTYKVVNSVGEWYKKLPTKRKIAISCAIAAGTLAGGFAIGGAGLMAAALTARTIQKGLFATSAVFAVDAGLRARAEKRKNAGKDEDWITKRRELLAVSAGISYLILPRIFSSEVKDLVQNLHVTDHIKSWFLSIKSSLPDFGHAEVPPVSHVSITEQIKIPHEEISIPETPHEIPPTPEPTIDQTVPGDEIGQPKDAIPTPKRAIFIDDSLGKKGNSIWGSLKNNGVSEKAIANYEKLHPREINRLARNGQVVTFSYDKETNVLSDVKVEKLTGKIAKKAAKAAATLTDHTENEIPSKSGIAVEKPEVEARVKTKLKVPKIKPTDFPLPENDSEIKDILDMVDDKSKIDLSNPASAEESSLFNDLGKVPDSLVKDTFGNMDGKVWHGISNLKASEVLKAKNDEGVLKLFKKGDYTFEDAHSGRSAVVSLSDQSGLKPKRGESVAKFAARAVKKLSKLR